MKYFVPVILGTAREGRYSEFVAQFVLEELKKRDDVETELIDVRDFLRDHTARQKQERAGQDVAQEKIQRADGYVIVSPEYNHGYPGELKIFLDTFYEEYEKKPVAICGVSDGIMGGVRMMEQLRSVVITLGLVPIRAAVYFPFIDKSVAAKAFPDQASVEKRLGKMFDELLWFTRTLKAGRKIR